jgi:hypothetical protein
MFWVREIVGWLLVLLGLYLFFVCYCMLINDPPYILEAPLLTVIGVFVFRGGIHLLKVAVAARVCQQAQQRVDLTTSLQVQRGSSRAAGPRRPVTREEM